MIFFVLMLYYVKTHYLRRDGRVVEGATLEMWCTARYRGFESLSLRHFFCSVIIVSNPCKKQATALENFVFQQLLLLFTGHFCSLQKWGLLTCVRVALRYSPLRSALLRLASGYRPRVESLLPFPTKLRHKKCRSGTGLCGEDGF